MGMVTPVYYTADMVRALPHDGNRYEVVHGELLVTPAPRPSTRPSVSSMVSTPWGLGRERSNTNVDYLRSIK